MVSLGYEKPQSGSEGWLSRDLIKRSLGKVTENSERCQGQQSEKLGKQWCFFANFGKMETIAHFQENESD